MTRLCNDLESGSLSKGSSALLSHDRLKDAISLLDGSYVLNYPKELKEYATLKPVWGMASDRGEQWDSVMDGEQGGSAEQVMAIGPPNMARVKRSLEDVGLYFSVAVESKADREAKRRRIEDMVHSRMAPRPDAYVIVLKG